MEVIDGNFVLSNLVHNPEKYNPEYVSKVNFFYLSKKGKLVVGYWEAPKGWFDAIVDGHNEVQCVIDGEFEFISDGKTMTAKKGDFVLIKNGDKIRFEIKKYAKTFFTIYPITTDFMEKVKKMMGDKIRID